MSVPGPLATVLNTLAVCIANGNGFVQASSGFRRQPYLELLDQHCDDAFVFLMEGVERLSNNRFTVRRAEPLPLGVLDPAVCCLVRCRRRPPMDQLLWVIEQFDLVYCIPPQLGPSGGLMLVRQKSGL